MSETLSGAVAALRRTGDMLSEASIRLAAIDPGASAFGAGGAGRLGDVGRELYLQWQRALDARVREAAAHGARFDEIADATGRAGGGYADTDDTASRHQPEAM